MFTDNILHKLPEGAENIALPQLFTYPFCYTPHPLCKLATDEIINHVNANLHKETWSSGKMFGVLIVTTREDTIDNSDGTTRMASPCHTGGEGSGVRGFYLAAFSGILEGTYHHQGFVPPVYDLQDKNGYFAQEENNISDINRRLADLNNDGPLAAKLRDERRTRSHTLQKWTFHQFRMLNALGEERDLIDIFSNQPRIYTAEEYYNRKNGITISTEPLPPAGTGECCAPKLLQYAYKHDLKPVAMAEFWIGESPKEEIRTEGSFYPSCGAKCRPVLAHMLKGLNVEENPMLSINREQMAKVRFLYEDSDICVVYKPSGILSQPGKDDVPSLLDAIRERHPEAEGPIIAHRLDMDTSGVMVTALNTPSYLNLQEQFSHHQVEKIYKARLDHPGTSITGSGVIRLPLMANPLDRPRQVVNYDHGKKAFTRYTVLSPTDVEFIPQTGRTHQLRVHAAHPDGLGCPIKGDRLYGTASDRLYLCAERLAFKHPRTGEWMHFNVKDWD